MTDILSDCHAKNNPAPWFEACIRSECTTEQDHNAICNVLSVYAQVCSRTLGRHLGQWRNDEFCPIQCPAGHIFSECGSLCPNTCQSPVSNMIDSYCTSECFPSCICPEGLLEHNNMCIKR